MPDAGHSALEPGIRAALVNATESYRLSVADEELFAPRFPWEAVEAGHTLRSMTFELPPEQTGAAAWYGPEMARRTDWQMPLSPAEIAEVEAATKALASREADIAAITPRDFPLPTLGPKLKARVEGEVLNGRGFLLLRGLPVERWTMREAATAFFGLGSPSRQRALAERQGPCAGPCPGSRPRRRTIPTSASTRPTSARPIHTNSCDIVGLLCLKTAKSGGLSALVSSTTIFNEMRRRRPDLLKLLFEPLATDRRGEVPEGQKPYFEIPVFNWHKGYLTRDLPAPVHRFGAALRRRAAAVAGACRGARHVRRAGQRSQRCIMFMEFKPGDVQLVHNHTMLHDRTGFVDWPEPERRRHLLRLWLAAAEARPLPRGIRPALRQRDGRRSRRHHRARHQAARAACSGVTQLSDREAVDPDARSSLSEGRRKKPPLLGTTYGQRSNRGRRPG